MNTSCPPPAAILFTLLALAGHLTAQEDPDPGEAPRIVRFQGLEIDLTRREVRATGKFLLDRGVIELLATAAGGKEHESLFVLECQPSRLQAAMILIGLEKGRGVRFQGEDATPTGSRVEILARWTDAAGETVEVPVEGLIWDRKRAETMPRSGWIFTGSRFMEHPRSGREVFMADVTGVLIVTYHDPDAVVDTASSGGADDTLYSVHTEAVPAPGTEVTLVLRAWPDGPEPGGDPGGDEKDRE